MDQVHDTPNAVPPTASTPKVDTATRRRTGWVIAVTLAALAVLIIVVLYTINVL